MQHGDHVRPGRGASIFPALQERTEIVLRESPELELRVILGEFPQDPPVGVRGPRSSVPLKSAPVEEGVDRALDSHRVPLRSTRQEGRTARRTRSCPSVSTKSASVPIRKRSISASPSIVTSPTSPERIARCRSARRSSPSKPRAIVLQEPTPADQPVVPAVHLAHETEPSSDGSESHGGSSPDSQASRIRPSPRCNASLRVSIRARSVAVGELVSVIARPERSLRTP